MLGFTHFSFFIKTAFDEIKYTSTYLDFDEKKVFKDFILIHIFKECEKSNNDN